jgi:hypothetical protein
MRVVAEGRVARRRDGCEKEWAWGSPRALGGDGRSPPGASGVTRAETRGRATARSAARRLRRPRSPSPPRARGHAPRRPFTHRPVRARCAYSNEPCVNDTERRRPCLLRGRPQAPSAAPRTDAWRRPQARRPRSGRAPASGGSYCSTNSKSSALPSERRSGISRPVVPAMNVTMCQYCDMSRPPGLSFGILRAT